MPSFGTAATIAASLGIAPNTARSYLDALEQTYMIRRLLPWQANLGKRLVKTPKIYFRDSGIFHTLSGIHNPTDAHLATLAERHDCRLATLDEGIPNAFLIHMRQG